MVIYPDEDYADDEETSEYSQIVGKAKKKMGIELLNKRAISPEEMDSLFLGE